ncbi:hypothetical protein D3C71_1238800 [compost metagenome]
MVASRKRQANLGAIIRIVHINVQVQGLVHREFFLVDGGVQLEFVHGQVFVQIVQCLLEFSLGFAVLYIRLGIVEHRLFDLKHGLVLILGDNVQNLRHHLVAKDAQRFLHIIVRHLELNHLLRVNPFRYAGILRLNTLEVLGFIILVQYSAHQFIAKLLHLLRIHHGRIELGTLLLGQFLQIKHYKFADNTFRNRQERYAWHFDVELLFRHNHRNREAHRHIALQIKNQRHFRLHRLCLIHGVNRDVRVLQHAHHLCCHIRGFRARLIDGQVVDHQLALHFIRSHFRRFGRRSLQRFLRLLLAAASRQNNSCREQHRRPSEAPFPKHSLSPLPIKEIITPLSMINDLHELINRFL